MNDLVNVTVIVDPPGLAEKYAVTCRAARDNGAWDKSIGYSGPRLRPLFERAAWALTVLLSVEDHNDVDEINRCLGQGAFDEY